jgi:glucose-6-phosphate dehydrogenase assembly protein OpcA
VEAAVTTGAVSDVVASIERELAAFWSAPDTSTGRSLAKVRASTMNFVVASAPGELDRLRTQLAEVAETRAGRVFLATVDGRKEPWHVVHEVSAVCRKDGDDVICHDRVELTFGAMAALRAGSVIGALSLAEVPTIFEVGKGAPAALVNELSKTAARIIVDSAHTPAMRIDEIARTAAAPVADRAMVRGFSWRELVARFFDGASATAQAIRTVEIGRTGGGAQEPAAMLLGWLGSRLGWTFESRTLARARSGEPVTIALAESGRTDLGPGELTAVRLEATEGGAGLEACCERTADPSIVSWSLKGARSETHQHALGFRDETWVLVKAIDATDGDRVYKEAFAKAAEWSAR